MDSELTNTAAASFYTIHPPLYLMIEKQVSEPKAIGESLLTTAPMVLGGWRTSSPGTTGSFHHVIITAWSFVTENRAFIGHV